MAHFAKINNGVITQVIVVANEDCAGGQFPTSEQAGQAFITSLGVTGEWKQTSYNNNFRKQFAGIGYTFDADNDVFIAPQPFASWSLDEDFDWRPPVPMPDDGGQYSWDEDSAQWVEGV